MKLTGNKLQFNDCSREVIGCSMRVHSELGNGFQEVIYQRALEIEFKSIQLEYFREVDISVFYKNVHVGTRRVDFVVKNELLLEIKAVSNLNNTHIAQGINYLEAYNIQSGLLINFGSNSLEFKRLINNKFTQYFPSSNF